MHRIKQMMTAGRSVSSSRKAATVTKNISHSKARQRQWPNNVFGSIKGIQFIHTQVLLQQGIYFYIFGCFFFLFVSICHFCLIVEPSNFAFTTFFDIANFQSLSISMVDEQYIPPETWGGGGGGVCVCALQIFYDYDNLKFISLIPSFKCRCCCLFPCVVVAEFHSILSFNLSAIKLCLCCVCVNAVDALLCSNVRNYSSRMWRRMATATWMRAYSCKENTKKKQIHINWPFDNQNTFKYKMQINTRQRC